MADVYLQWGENDPPLNTKTTLTARGIAAIQEAYRTAGFPAQVKGRIMGEIADMMMDGEVCSLCGAFIDEHAVGVPRLCVSCSRSKPKQAGPKPGKHRPKSGPAGRNGGKS